MNRINYDSTDDPNAYRDITTPNIPSTTVSGNDPWWSGPVARTGGSDPVPTPTPTPTPGPAPGTGGTGGLIDPFPGMFQAPTPIPYQAPPQFQAPSYTPPPAFTYAQFQAPTFDQALNDPGFQFVQQMGQRGVERSAAARGVLNSGGTLQDIANFNQSLAESQYGNVFNRNLGAWQQNYNAAVGQYNTNYQTQYLDPYKNAYQSALDTYNPQFSAWQTNTAATQRQNEFDYAGAMDRYKFDYQRWLDRINTSVNLQDR